MQLAWGFALCIQPLRMPAAACRSSDPRYEGGMHAIKVVDRRPLTGDSIQQPRTISQLPFTDTDVTSRFSSKYLFSSSGNNPAAVRMDGS